MNNEAFARNYVVQAIHNTKLPSYCVWDQESIEDSSKGINFNWWVSIDKMYMRKKNKVTDLADIINKWKQHYRHEEEPPAEYCSKRMGDYLSCDI